MLTKCRKSVPPFKKKKKKKKKTQQSAFDTAEHVQNMWIRTQFMPFMKYLGISPDMNSRVNLYLNPNLAI